MKIVNISGGLGNQMFQYAFALALKHQHPKEDIYIDIQHYHTIFFKRYKSVNLHNGYEIDKVFPNANIPVASFKQLIKLTYWMPNYVLSRVIRKIFPIRKTEYVTKRIDNQSFDKKALYYGQSCYYEGYWQSIHYYLNIKEEILRVYSHQHPNAYNAALIKEMETNESVGIHVRRGDYLYSPDFQGICNLDYYKKAISGILSDGVNHVFYIFSNDIAWCRENLLELLHGQKCVFCTENKGNNSCWDMFLMTHCKDLIIANSSFSWWGAFLNKRVNRVYAPYPWFNRDCELDVYDESWIKVK